VRGLVAGLAFAAWIVACGGRQAPNDCARGSVCWHLQMATEITNLSSEIRKFRRDLGFERDPTPSDLIQMKGKTVHEARAICPDHHEVPASCSDVCILADHICDDAEAICGIAKELGADDDFAQQKCASATASCRQAKQRCCACASNQDDTR
jgi:hypothetical protein